MKLLLLTEYKDGKALAISNELIAFAEKMGAERDRKSTRLNSSHMAISRMPSSA
jgi:hypothetical protein